MDIGFIGLGAMGRAMAANLVEAGHRVRVWNRTRGPVDQLAGLGAEPAATPREALAEVVISMLADDDAVREVILAQGVLDAARAGTIHVNMATISVGLAQSLTDEHRRRGLHYVAAPVFGRPDAAAAGQLNIVAAGEGEVLDRVQPLFDAIGRRTWRMGREPRQANAVKLAGNFMIASAIESMAEAAAMTERYGVPAAEMLNVLTNTLFAAPAYQGYGGLIASRRYEPAGFRLVLGLKDLGLALAAGEDVRVPMPFASILRDQLLEAVAQGRGDQDWASLAEVARRRAGLT
jgi:3-hydroxyisobutyrate dehydrogenase-like beta-hydroxyacid dehydrogenase